jgi:hypothetical protein
MGFCETSTQKTAPIALPPLSHAATNPASVLQEAMRYRSEMGLIHEKQKRKQLKVSKINNSTEVGGAGVSTGQ